MTLRTVLFVILMALIAAPTAIADDGPEFEGPQAEIDAIFALLGEMEKRRDAGDTDGVIALHHPDIRIMTRGREILTGPEGVRTFYGANYNEGSTRKLYSDLRELRVFGDVAMMMGRFLAVDPSEALEDPGYYVIILRKNKTGDWRVYRDIDTPSPDGLVLKPAE